VRLLQYDTIHCYQGIYKVKDIYEVVEEEKSEENQSQE
jgi:hypothetical protein